MTEIISNLMEANLLRVFNERDAQRRAATIETTLPPDAENPLDRPKDDDHRLAVHGIVSNKSRPGSQC